MKTLQFQGVSQNLKYIFTNKGIVPISNTILKESDYKFIDYSFENLNLAVEIMMEHNELFYKNGVIKLTEYTTASRKFLNNLVEIFQPQNSIQILSEFETKVGSKLLLLNESVDKNIIENNVKNSWNYLKLLVEDEVKWYNPVSWNWKKGAQNVANFAQQAATDVKDWGKEQVKQIKQKGLGTYLKDKASSIWDSVKNAVKSAYKCLTNNFAECLFENLRKAAMSPVGMGVMVGLSYAIPGVGQVPDIVVFGSLLIWDVYKMLSGKYESGEYAWGWGDIIIDSVMMLLPFLGPILKGLLGGVKSIGQFAAKAFTKGGALMKAFNLLKAGASKLIGFIGKASAWIGEKLGLTWLKNIGPRAESVVSNMTKELEAASAAGRTFKPKEALTQTIKKGQQTIQKAGQELSKKGSQLKQFFKDGKLLNPVPVIARKTGKTIVLTAAFCAAMGVDGYTCEEKAENGEFTQEMVDNYNKGIQNYENAQVSQEDFEKFKIG
jgi:biotin operon repressor